MIKSKATTRRSRAQWDAIIADQEASGESVPDYCRRRQLNVKNFYNRRKRLRSGLETKPETFVRIEAMSSPGQVLCIQTPGGYRLEVPAGTDGAFVRSILATMP